MASNQVVPVVPDYLDIYPTDAQPVQKRRWEHLLAKFEELYERPAQFVSRSPGRVNLIGEVCATSSAGRCRGTFYLLIVI